MCNTRRWSWVLNRAACGRWNASELSQRMPPHYLRRWATSRRRRRAGRWSWRRLPTAAWVWCQPAPCRRRRRCCSATRRPWVRQLRPAASDCCLRRTCRRPWRRRTNLTNYCSSLFYRPVSHIIPFPCSYFLEAGHEAVVKMLYFDQLRYWIVTNQPGLKSLCHLGELLMTSGRESLARIALVFH